VPALLFKVQELIVIMICNRSGHILFQQVLSQLYINLFFSSALYTAEIFFAKP